MDNLIAQLKSSIETIVDPSDKEIARAMMILVSSLEIGANVERLAKRTGFSSETIRAISNNMVNAGLWIEEMVDDSEWWDESGDLDGVSLFTHAHVALGSVVRKTLPNCILYTDRETGKEVLRRKRTLH